MKFLSFLSRAAKKIVPSLPDLYRVRGLRPDPAQEGVIDRLQALSTHLTLPRSFFRRLPERQGLYIWGGVGRGKTMLMDMFYDSLPPSLPRRRVHFHAFMIEVQDYLHRTQKAEGGAALPNFARQLAKSVRLLCFDEFHVTDIADAMILSRLFTALFKAGLTIVTTSNWPPARLYEGGLQRDLFLPFIELIEKRLDILHLDNGIDYRFQVLSETGVYFYPLGAVATAQADALFARLTGEGTTVADILVIKGRTLSIISRNGIARCGFAQLCEQPLGAEDYLAVADRYETLFLENIPTLNYDRANETKRLMTLVDALYDAKTRLVVTAAAPPDQLYRADKYSYEFERTVSRLLEMQGPAYLAALRR